jgi:hypothetical protein
MRDALERIAAEQKVYKGHGDYEIVPALTAEEAQSVAREALSLLTTKASDDELVEALDAEFMAVHPDAIIYDGRAKCYVFDDRALQSSASASVGEG